MEFAKVLDTLSPITDFGTDDEYSLEHHKFVAITDHFIADNLIGIISNQTRVINPEYSVFKQSYTDNKFEHITDITSKKDRIYHSVVNASDDHLILNILSVTYMSDFIKANIKQRFIFMVTDHFSETSEVGHRSCLVIDNKHKKIYTVDPNGSSEYFNDTFKVDISNQVEKLFDNYFAQLKIFGMNYDYVYTNSWNSANVSINNQFDNELIGSGHCVVLTMILINIINSLEEEPINVMTLLKTLSNEELLFIISRYTTAIYNIVKHNM